MLLLAAGPATVAGEEAAVTGTVRISPLVITLELEAATVGVGTPVKARATVGNVGIVAVRRVDVALRLDPVGLVLRGPTTRHLQQVREGRSATVPWAMCGSVPGTYVVLAQASADGVTVESAARLLTIAPGNRRSC